MFPSKKAELKINKHSFFIYKSLFHALDVGVIQCSFPSGHISASKSCDSRSSKQRACIRIYLFYVVMWCSFSLSTLEKEDLSDFGIFLAGNDNGVNEIKHT